MIQSPHSSPNRTPTKPNSLLSQVSPIAFNTIYPFQAQPNHQAGEVFRDVLSIVDITVTQGFCSCWLGRRTRRWGIVCKRTGLRRVEAPLAGMLAVIVRLDRKRGEVEGQRLQTTGKKHPNQKRRKGFGDAKTLSVADISGCISCRSEHSSTH